MFELPDDGPLPEITMGNERLSLRPYSMQDLDLVKQGSADDFIPTITTIPADYTPETGRAYVDRQASRLTSRLGWPLVIVDPATELGVGQIGLWVPNLHQRRAEIGYWIAPAHRRQGWAGAAVQMLGEWAFANLAVDRLSLYIEPWNTGSIRTALHAGYQREGLMHGWQPVGGNQRDMWSYVLTREPLADLVAEPRTALVDELRDLEEGMWRSNTRFNHAWMEENLAPEFTEFGRSGRRYTRAEILALEVRDIDAELPLANFSARMVSYDCVLVTYLGVVGGARSNRTSLWRHDGRRWLMTFHQGTPTDENTAHVAVLGTATLASGDD